MNETDPRSGRMLLLGEDFGEYGTINSARVGTEAAVGISVGADKNSPSMTFKYNPNVANEDTACIITTPDWVGMAVADAHYGEESSHMLVSRLDEIWSKVPPQGPEHLEQMMDFLRQGEPARTESETTLLVVVYDRASHSGYGVSYGDSTFTIGGRDRIPVNVNERDNTFVTAANAQSFRGGRHFGFTAEPGELLMAYTDGIDGCHYRNPETSVQPIHMHQAMILAAFDPLDSINRIMKLALSGVDGNPGGQDNIAMAVAIA